MRAFLLLVITVGAVLLVTVLAFDLAMLDLRQSQRQLARRLEGMGGLVAVAVVARFTLQGEFFLTLDRTGGLVAVRAVGTV